MASRPPPPRPEHSPWHRCELGTSVTVWFRVGWGEGSVRHQYQASEGGRASAGVGEEGGVNPTDQFDSPTSAVQDAATYVSSPPPR